MRSGTNRRDFLAGSAAAIAGLGSLTAAATGSESPAASSEMPIVDAHHHLWDLSKFRLKWTEQEPWRKLHRNFSLNDFRKATAGLNVVKSIYVEVDVPVSQQVAEAQYIIELCKRCDNRLVAAVISGRPAAAGFKQYVMRFKDSPYIKGLRDILFDKPRGYCLDAKFIAGVRLLGELGLSFDIETPPDRLADAEKLIAACPDTRFVVDHCGNPDLQSKDHSQWRRETAAIAKRKNAVVKISGILTSAKKGAWSPEDLMPHINHLREVFGPDRLMFGSDWPVVTMKATYQQWTAALRTVVRDWSQQDQRKLFHDNAVRFFGLA